MMSGQDILNEGGVANQHGHQSVSFTLLLESFLRSPSKCFFNPANPLFFLSCFFPLFLAVETSPVGVVAEVTEAVSVKSASDSPASPCKRDVESEAPIIPPPPPRRRVESAPRPVSFPAPRVPGTCVSSDV